MIYQPIPERRCTKCGSIYPRTLEYFARSAIHNEYLRPECKCCHNKEGRDYKRKHRQEIRNKSRAYNRAHKDDHKQYRIEHRTKIVSYLRQYNATHTEENRQRNKRYHARKADERHKKNRQWARNNPDKIRSAGAKRRTLKRNLPATFTHADWQRALDYWHGCCAYCGNPPSLFDRQTVLHQEHHIPLSPNYELIETNPGYVAENILPACQGCNYQKKNKNPEQWLIQRFGAHKAKQILKHIRDYFEWIKQQRS